MQKHPYMISVGLFYPLILMWIAAMRKKMS